jgi:hypothetical protein
MHKYFYVIKHHTWHGHDLHTRISCGTIKKETAEDAYKEISKDVLQDSYIKKFERIE